MLKALTVDLMTAAERGLKQLYLKSYKAASENVWAPLFTTYSDADETENYGALGAVAQLRPWTGSREFTTRRVDGLSVKSEEYDVAFAVPMMDIQRDKLGRYASWPQAAGQRAATYMIPLIRSILTNGTSATLAKCWDGKSLFNASHGKGKGTGQSNIISGSGADTLDKVQTDIEKCVSAGTAFKDDQGLYIEPIVYNTVIYPATNYALGKTLRTIAGDRQGDGKPDQSGLIKSIIPCPDITGNTWYFAAGGGPERPFGWQEELAPTPETASDFDTREVKFAVHASGAAFPADWTTILQVDNS